MKQDIGISVQHLVTLEERSMLIEISQCDSLSEIEKIIISTWYGNKTFVNTSDLL